MALRYMENTRSHKDFVDRVSGINRTAEVQSLRPKTLLDRLLRIVGKTKSSFRCGHGDAGDG